MLLAVWIALALGVVAFVAGLTVAVTHAFRAWRSFKRVTRNVSSRLDELAAKATAVEEKAVAATGNSAKLADAAARLQQSLAALAVLRAALAEATSGAGRVRSAVPRK